MRIDRNSIQENVYRSKFAKFLQSFYSLLMNILLMGFVYWIIDAGLCYSNA